MFRHSTGSEISLQAVKEISGKLRGVIGEFWLLFKKRRHRPCSGILEVPLESCLSFSILFIICFIVPEVLSLKFFPWMLSSLHHPDYPVKTWICLPGPTFLNELLRKSDWPHRQRADGKTLKLCLSKFRTEKVKGLRRHSVPLSGSWDED